MFKSSLPERDCPTFSLPIERLARCRTTEAIQPVSLMNCSIDHHVANFFRVADVDEIFRKAQEAGYSPDSSPSDASWGERYFHITDPDGHELSFARPLGA